MIGATGRGCVGQGMARVYGRLVLLRPVSSAAAFVQSGCKGLGSMGVTKDLYVGGVVGVHAGYVRVDYGCDGVVGIWDRGMRTMGCLVCGMYVKNMPTGRDGGCGGSKSRVWGTRGPCDVGASLGMKGFPRGMTDGDGDVVSYRSIRGPAVNAK